MSDQLPTKDQVSLDHLKRAISAAERPSLRPPMSQLEDLRNERSVSTYEHFRAEAWRTAFQWLLQYASTHGDQYPTFMEGISLIREKLK